MGINKYPQFPLRLNPLLIDKMRVIANQNGRSTNKEIEQLIIKCIEEFETSYWKITEEDIERVKTRK
jgi:hypothetical protein